MDSSTLISLLLVSFLVGVTHAALLGSVTGGLCPLISCPTHEVCVISGFVRKCLEKAKKGEKCSRKKSQNKDGSYNLSATCAPGLKCPPNVEDPYCE